MDEIAHMDSSKKDVRGEKNFNYELDEIIEQVKQEKSPIRADVLEEIVLNNDKGGKQIKQQFTEFDDLVDDFN